jgi:carboxylate-amine ligase
MDGTTFGVEEELLVVDRETGALVPRSDELVPLARERLGERVTAELNRCQIEVASPIFRDLPTACEVLHEQRAALDAAAGEIGLSVLAAGTHPWSSWRDQEIEDDRPRFREMEERFQRVARQQVICGCHVHVGLDEPERVPVMTRVRPWLPVLAALAANSPFWDGEDTGYDSYRLEVWARWPTAGFPPHLEDGAEYAALVDELRTAGAIEDSTHLYWYLRPSERYPTLEFRVTDVCGEVDEAVAIAGLARALVAWGRRSSPDAVPPEVLDAALWQAARYGLGAELQSPTDRTLRPAADVVDELLDTVGPDLDAAGDLEVVTSVVRRIVTEGNGATRQRRVD